MALRQTPPQPQTAQTQVAVKLIYLPPHTSGKKPHVIHVIRLAEGEVAGSRLPDEAADGRFQWYPLKRCLPYTEENVRLIQHYLDAAAGLEGEYKDLERRAARKKTL